MIAAGVSAGAILRAGARVFLGWGPQEDPLLSEEPREEPPEGRPSGPLMNGVTAALLVLGLAASLVPGLESRSEHAADRFRDRPAYVERILHGKVEAGEPAGPDVLRRPTTPSVFYGVAAGLLAIAVMQFGLFRARLPELVRTGAGRALGPTVAALRAVHSGVAGDYVMWLTVGTALMGGIWAITLR